MIQPSIERTATAPEEVCWSVVEGLEPLRGGELSMSISLDAIVADVVGVRANGFVLGTDDGGLKDDEGLAIRVVLYARSWHYSRE